MKTKSTLHLMLAAFSLGSILLLFACAPKQSPQPVFLSIKLEDSTKTPVVLVRTDDLAGYRDYFKALDTVAPGPDNWATFEWEADQPGFYQLFGADGWPIVAFPLYLEGGDSLSLFKPLKGEDPIQYKGDLADFYPFFHEYTNVTWRDSLMKARWDKRYYMDPDTFRAFMDRRREALLDVYERFAAPLPQQHPMAAYARGYLEYPFQSDHYDYLEYHNYYANDTFLYFFPDSAFLSFQQKPVPDPAPFLFSSQYIDLMKGKLEYLFQKKNQDLSDSLKWALLLQKKAEIIQQDLEGIDQDFAYLALATDFTHFMEQEHFFEEMRALKAQMEGSHSAPEMFKKFTHFVDKMETLAPGQPAPPLTLPDAMGTEISLSDFLGKVVYLDFWGTWCYPCLQELPHSLALQEKFKDRDDIVFLYVALEYDQADIDRWRKFVTGEEALSYASFLEKRPYPGIHLVAERQFGNPGIKPFIITYAPTYVLIDAEGKIARPRAPRPSAGEEIERLLQELADAPSGQQQPIN